MYVTRFTAALILLCLSACAPVMLGRTPMPVPVGEVGVSSMTGYPVLFTVFPVNKPAMPTPFESLVDIFTAPFDKYLAYAPMPGLAATTLSYGVTPGTELNAVASLIISPGLRLGGKTLLLDSDIRFAADYGVFADSGSFGADLGFLASVPAPGVEFYGGLRGFVWVPYEAESSNTTLAGALTLGGAVPVDSEPDTGRVFLELTLLANGYSGSVPTTVVQPVGFSLMPAVGFAF